MFFYTCTCNLGIPLKSQQVLQHYGSPEPSSIQQAKRKESQVKFELFSSSFLFRPLPKRGGGFLVLYLGGLFVLVLVQVNLLINNWLHREEPQLLLANVKNASGRIGIIFSFISIFFVFDKRLGTESCECSNRLPYYYLPKSHNQQK